MKSVLNENIERIRQSRHSAHRYLAVFLVLAALTTLGVNWGLHRSGNSLSQTADYVCGYTEHTHTDACYTQVLTCGLEESEATEGHTHSEACYDADGSLICGLEESEATEGHTHTEACYSTELTCELPEHVHSTDCLGSDPTADVETAVEWEATLPSTTGIWANDLISVAQSQLGYTESTRNYDTETGSGYTRYGAWYGNQYGDWDAMFVAFCLNYANIPSSAVPSNSGVSAWIVDLKNAGLYQDSSYTPVAGDLVFLADNQVGIITSVSGSTVSVIQGDLNDAVATASYSTSSGSILGYCQLPENPDVVSSAKVSTVSLFEDETDEESGVSPQNDSTTPISMNGIVIGVTGSGTTYDAVKNVYSSNLSVNFQFKTANVKSNGLYYYYQLPDGVEIPSSLIDGKENVLLDTSGKQAGTYRFAKESDGTYRIYITLLQTYVDSTTTGETITGYVRFNGQFGGDKGNKDGSVTIKGQDGVDINIPGDQITYPDGETNAYDISTSKSGSYSVKDGKLIYTVYVTSVKGTPTTIDFTDTITATGMTLGTPTVTVTEQTINRYDYGNGNFGYTDESIVNKGSVSVNPTCSDGTFSMTLPQISPAVDSKDQLGAACKVVTRYKVEYSYPVDNAANGSYATNTIKANSNDGKTEVKSTSNWTVTIRNSKTISKTSWYDQNNSRIMWTITLNANKVDIAGGSLSDEMLAQLATGTDVTINPNTGYTITKDSDGKITGITFDATEDGVNLNQYTITYYTPVDATWNDQTITNKATFTDKDGGKTEGSGSATISGGSVEKTHGDVTTKDGKTVIPWIVTVNVPESGLPATTTIKDAMSSSSEKSQQYMTRTQVIQWANNIYWADANGNKIGTSNIDLRDNAQVKITFAASDGNEYTFKQINDNSGGKFDNMTYTVWTITLGEELVPPAGAAKMIFSYSTTANTDDAESGKTTYSNKVEIGKKTAEATYDNFKGGLIKTDSNGNTDTSSVTNGTGELVWKLTPQLTGPTTKVVFTDTLPDGVTLESVGAAGWITGFTNMTINDDGTFDGNNTVYRIYGTVKDNVVTATLTYTEAHLSAGSKLNTDATYTIVLNCKVDTSKLEDYEVGKTYTFKNTATAKDDNGELGGADQTQNWTEKKTTETTKVIEKTGAWDNSTRTVNYSIALNPDGKDILEGADVLTLKDVFTYYPEVYAQDKNDTSGSTKGTFEMEAWLMQPSVKLYKATKNADGTLTKGEEITTWNWTVETADRVSEWDPHKTSTLKATGIPDETPLILEYSYQISTNIPAGYVTTQNMDITNSATLEGTDEKSDKTQYDTKWEDSDHSALVTTNITYTIYKVSAGDYSKTLPNATFRLDYYDTGTGEYVSTGKTYTTDNGGVVAIQWQVKDGTSISEDFSYNTLYRLVEVTPPGGYSLPEDPEANALYFYIKNTEDTTHTLPSTLPSNAMDISKNSKTVYVENYANATDITVNKNWVKFNGDADLMHTGSINVDLYRTESTADPSQGSGANLQGKIWLGAVNNSLLKDIDSTSHTAGTKATFSMTYTNQYGDAPTTTVTLNGATLTPTVTKDSATYSTTYTYTFTLTAGSNEISGLANNWEAKLWTISDITFNEATPSEAVKVGTYTISSSENWTKTISDLPLTGKNEAGEKVYYSYSIKEQDMEGYSASYENNGGITSGTITVTNKATSEASYKLPESGGAGTTLYTSAGIALLGAGLLYGISQRRRHGRRAAR